MGHVWASGRNGEILRATDVLLDFFSRWTMERRSKAAATLPDASGSSILQPVGLFALFVPAMLAVIQLA
jgi:hypothetical protein